MRKNGLFDVTMGTYHGAEVCELIWTFLSDKISVKYDKDGIGLYLNDGLSVFKNKSRTQLEIIKTAYKSHSKSRNNGRIEFTNCKLSGRDTELQRQLLQTIPLSRWYYSVHY